MKNNMYLLIRTYKDGSKWTTTGNFKRIQYLHSYCTGKAYNDLILKIK